MMTMTRRGVRERGLVRRARDEALNLKRVQSQRKHQNDLAPGPHRFF
jgi:hypothetical protein